MEGLVVCDEYCFVEAAAVDVGDFDSGDIVAVGVAVVCE